MDNARQPQILLPCPSMPHALKTSSPKHNTVHPYPMIPSSSSAFIIIFVIAFFHYIPHTLTPHSPSPGHPTHIPTLVQKGCVHTSHMYILRNPIATRVPPPLASTYNMSLVSDFRPCTSLSTVFLFRRVQTVYKCIYVHTSGTSTMYVRMYVLCMYVLHTTGRVE